MELMIYMRFLFMYNKNVDKSSLSTIYIWLCETNELCETSEMLLVFCFMFCDYLQIIIFVLKEVESL